MSKYISGTLAADGSSSSIAILERGVLFIGSTGGTNFGGGSAYLQAQGPDGLWYTASEAYTASTTQYLDMGSPTVVRLTIAGSSSPDLDYAIQSDTPSA